MRGDEQRVVDQFTVWLQNQGWATEHEVDFVDILATKGEQRMYVEAKGRTPSPGLDMDTMFGQLLRRMPADEVGVALFAVVVPAESLRFVERVPARVRRLLRIQAYGVHLDGSVLILADTSSEQPTRER